MALSDQKNNLPYAIVICLDSLSGIQTARILSRCGIPVIGIAKDPKHFACRTNVCKKILITDTDSDELVDTLKTLEPMLKEKAVLYPCSDTSVLVLAHHQKDLNTAFHVVLPSVDVIEMMVDKVRFYQYAQEHQFPITETYILCSRENAEEAAQKMTFPAVLKPPYRPEEWRKHTREKGFKVFSAEELLSRYDQCSKWADSLIIQGWIEGPDTNHITCNCYFSSTSDPLVTFTSRKLRQWPQKTGQGCFGEAFKDERVASETIKLYQSLGFRGLAYLEMKRDARSGEYFIIEPNVGRPTGRSATAEANGVELLYTMYCDATGRPLPENRVQKDGNVKWIYLRQDIQSAMTSWFHGELTLREWFRSLRGPKWFAIYSRTDPAPFWYDVWEAVKYQVRRKFLKK